MTRPCLAPSFVLVAVLLIAAGCSSNTPATAPGSLATVPPASMPVDSVAASVADSVPVDSVPADTVPAATEPAVTDPTRNAGRYVDEVFTAVDRTGGIVYASAPDLVTGETVELHLDLFQPSGDSETTRPAIVWIHGGGFRGGNRSALGDIAAAYARRGYVTVSIDYRLDPGNRCQSLQDEALPAEQVATEGVRCLTAIRAAQYDAQAAVRWVRANAAELGVDVDRIAVGGSSAGALTAVHVAQRSEDPGDVGDHDDESSVVVAALAASGCNVDRASIDADDAPVFLLASELDRAVSFDCVTQTEEATRAAGAVVETMYFMGEATHAKALYEKYQPQVDEAWTEFLVTHLDLA